IPEGVKLPAGFLPPRGLDAHHEAEALRVAIERFATAAAPFTSHPLVGKLDRARWERYHCIHCAHHLSFVVPLKQIRLVQTLGAPEPAGTNVAAQTNAGPDQS